MNLNEKRPYCVNCDSKICAYSTQNDGREVWLFLNGVLGDFSDKVHNIYLVPGSEFLYIFSANPGVAVRLRRIGHRTAPALRKQRIAQPYNSSTQPKYIKIIGVAWTRSHHVNVDGGGVYPALTQSTRVYYTYETKNE